MVRPSRMEKIVLAPQKDNGGWVCDMCGRQMEMVRRVRTRERGVVFCFACGVCGERLKVNKGEVIAGMWFDMWGVPIKEKESLASENLVGKEVIKHG